MRRKHPGIKLTGAHGKPLQEMRRVLNAKAGVLPPRQRFLKKTGPIQVGVTKMAEETHRETQNPNPWERSKARRTGRTLGHGTRTRPG
eukprot:7765991-Pyramimonas_sp.AAC.1